MVTPLFSIVTITFQNLDGLRRHWSNPCIRNRFPISSTS